MASVAAFCIKCYRHVSPLKCLVQLSGKLYYSSGNEFFDLVVIGGGSGGLACAKQAADLGKRVVVLDYVTPSTQGTQWGIGGTCVNVGCIPKKLMHHAALLKESVEAAKTYGWDINFNKNSEIDWKILQQSVVNYVKSLNWGYRIQLKHKNIEYLNAKGSYISPNLIKAEFANGQTKILSTAFSVIAVGGRPKLPVNIQGANDLCITSDDIFYLKRPPGKTLVIGGGYVALECAGFLTGLGFETSVMIRSVPLRGFDQQMANLVVDYMSTLGTKILSNSVPIKIEKINENALVTWNSPEGIKMEEFSTVLLAVGRNANTASLNLQSINVEIHQNTGKVLTDDHDQTSVRSIFAIGDVLHDRPELTPVAIQAGKLLSKRLFSNSTELMDYEKVPTAIFTPLEYGSVGLSEENAKLKLGDDNIEIYQAFYKPLEFHIPKANSSQCYIKVICLRSKPQTVIGMHFIGPNAGEIMQGFAVSLKCGVTKDILNATIGIHPTCAEEIVKIHISKRSGADPTVTGC